MRDPDPLPLIALRYAAGDLPPDEAQTFEHRLACDQPARDALAEAVRLSAAASGLPAPTPDPVVRSAAADRVRPTLLSALFPWRRYRGHPAAWLALGGLAAAIALGVFNLDRRPPLAGLHAEPPVPSAPSAPPAAAFASVPSVPSIPPEVAAAPVHTAPVVAPLTDMRAESIVGPSAPPRIATPMPDGVPMPMTAPLVPTPRAEGPAPADGMPPVPSRLAP